MSDSEDSTITYTAVSSPFGGLSDIRSPGVDGPLVMPEDPYAYVVPAFQAPPSPDYVPGPEYPPSPKFVPEPVYPDFMPPEDEEDEEDPEKEPKEDPEEDPTNYPADGRDDDDDDESSDDDKDDDDDVKEDEEHPASANFVPPLVHRVTARISIRAQTPISLPLDIEVARLLAIPTPPPLPLSSWSSPLPQIPSPPLPVSPSLHVSPPPLPTSLTYPLGYRAAMIRLRAETPSTYHPLPSSTPPSWTPPLLPLPTLSPPFLLPSTVCRAGVSKVTLPPQKRLCIALGLRYEVGKSSSAPTARPTGGLRADYRFVGTLDDEIRRDPERYDTDEIYGRLDDAQDDREAIISREAWRPSMDASDTARSEVRALRTIVLAQQTEIAALRAADHA
ncbi:hypothetical protein Tco_0535520 [Tanacetum coccineum]